MVLEKQRIIRNQHEFTKSCQNNLSLFPSMVMRLRNQEKAMHMGFLKFNICLPAVPVDKMKTCGLGDSTVGLLQNGQATESVICSRREKQDQSTKLQRRPVNTTSSYFRSK